MTTTYDQSPVELDLKFCQGDDLSGPVFNWGMSLDGYIFEAAIETSPLTPINVNVTDSVNGQIQLSLGKDTTQSLEPGVYSWYLRWTVGGVSRKVFAGKAEVV